MFRILYAIGYTKCGPNFRAIGAVPNIPIILGLFGISAYSVIEIMDKGL